MSKTNSLIYVKSGNMVRKSGKTREYYQQIREKMKLSQGQYWHCIRPWKLFWYNCERWNYNTLLNAYVHATTTKRTLIIIKLSLSRLPHKTSFRSKVNTNYIYKSEMVPENIDKLWPITWYLRKSFTVNYSNIAINLHEVKGYNYPQRKIKMAPENIVIENSSGGV